MAKVKNTENKSKHKHKPKFKHKKREKSGSGKYKSMRHLMEVLFAENKNITCDEAKKIVSKEFPNSSYLKSERTHFPWYKTHLVSRGEFKIVEPPDWAKNINVK